MDQAAQIREKTDIIELIREYIPLKKAGRNFKANCPFHQEKSASFFISPERQMFHCFGCQKGGDVYTFLMEYEHMEFVEALRFLAKRTGITLTESSRTGFTQSKKERYYQINSYAAEFYHYLLVSHRAGKNALLYLGERKVNTGAMNTFKIGFAPKSGYALLDYMTKKKGVSTQEMIEVGLALRYSGRVIDFFRDRIVFPLIDHRDNTVGFSGRVLSDIPNAPKYINTRDTLVYHKGENFFGFSTARDEMRKTDSVLLVEGEFDVIACFQEGITNTIALKGTALTERQVSLLARFVTRVIMSLDDDKAGQDALVRSIALLEKAALHISVLVLPSGKDPADAILKDVGNFKKALKHDVPVYDYLIDVVLKEHDKTKAEGKRSIVEFMLPLIAGITNEVVKEHYLRRISAELDTTYESLLKEVERRDKNQRVEPVPKTRDEKKPRYQMLEEYLLALILQAEEQKKMGTEAADILSGYMKKDSSSQKILNILFTYLAANDKLDLKAFEENLPGELMHAFNKASLLPLTKLDDKHFLQEVEKVATDLLRLYLRADLSTLAGKIKLAEQSGDENKELLKLQEEYSKASERLAKTKI